MRSTVPTLHRSFSGVGSRRYKSDAGPYARRRIQGGPLMSLLLTAELKDPSMPLLKFIGAAKETLFTSDGVELAYRLPYGRATLVKSYFRRDVKPGRTTANWVSPEAIRRFRAEELKEEAE